LPVKEKLRLEKHGETDGTYLPNSAIILKPGRLAGMQQAIVRIAQRILIIVIMN
jgi:hypothetical protein